jgi:glyoxylase-like metal-dependent hydrolase (beta-lactamase superfamily II)
MKEITINDLTRRLVSGDAVAVVDIREAAEFNDWHIHGSTNVPVYDAINRGEQASVTDGLKSLPQNKAIVAVCHAGNTSKIVANVLESMGYDAFSLAGGMHGFSNAWTEAAVPTTDKNTKIIQIRRNGKGCLSYLVGHTGKAAVVDPCVDASVYTAVAEREGLQITHILETHVHADHISRAPALAEKTGALLCIPKNERVQFDYEAIEDGQTLMIGSLKCNVISTPGHTAESVCFQFGDHTLLSGDTIFVEAIGRPDLEKGDAGAEEGANMLYDSLHNKVLKIDDGVLVCPGHTSDPIAFDGVPLVAKLGDIKPEIDLLDVNKDQFVQSILENLGQKPPNFQRVLSVNEGRASLGFLDPLELEAGPNRCAVGKPRPS